MDSDYLCESAPSALFDSIMDYDRPTKLPKEAAFRNLPKGNRRKAELLNEACHSCSHNLVVARHDITRRPPSIVP
jgi:hypothetical protein